MSGLLNSARRLVIVFLLMLAGGTLIVIGNDGPANAAPKSPDNTVTPTSTVTGTPPTATNTRTATDTPTATATLGCDDWYEVANPIGGELVNTFYGMAAAGPDDVWAVGNRGDYGSANLRLMIDHWDGTAWTQLPVGTAGTLRGVSVVASSDVWAVGNTEDATKQTLTMHWDGSQWSTIPSPNVGTVSNYLYSVAAVASDDVWAVGKSGEQAIVLHWNGTQWSQAAIPAMDYSVLNGVAAAGPNDVWAVGSQGYYDHYTLVLHWDGSAWSQLASPSPVTFRNSLQSISVSADNDIWAAGWFTAGQSVFSPLILHWDGSQWSTSQITGQEGNKSSPETTGSLQLFGVAAESSTSAWAVGWGLDWTVRVNVIFKWNGTAWSRYTSPNSSGYANELFGVSVSAQGEAWAGGFAGDNHSVYQSQILRYGPPCGTATPTVTGTLPTATSTNTSTNTPVLPSATNTSIPPSATNTVTPAPTVCGVSLDEGFEGALGAFTNVVATCVPGGCDWASVSQTPHAGSNSAFAPDVNGTSDQYLEQVTALVPSAGTTLTFWHRYKLEVNFDGGVLEASTNGGSTWTDMGPNIVSGGYNGTISANFGSPIGGRPAWTGDFDASYTQVIVNLSPYAGQNLRIRFRLATDNSLAGVGWRLDDVVIGTSICATATAGGATSTATTEPNSTETATTEPIASETAALPTATASEVPPTEEVTETATSEATPTSEATSEASPTALACAIEFEDVPAGSPFYTQVMCLSCMGMVNGYPDGTFRPNNSITRGQLAKMVSNTAGFDGIPTGESFMDVASGSTFYMYAERMMSKHVLSGYTCGGPGEPCDASNRPYFRPSANTTRGQISKIVANAAEFNEPVSGRYYADVDEDNPFYEVIMRLTSRGVINGYACGGVNPQTGSDEPCDSQNRPYMRWGNLVTRGQAAKIVANAFYPDCQMR